jgi:hypothetical protein
VDLNQVWKEIGFANRLKSTAPIIVTTYIFRKSQTCFEKEELFLRTASNIP